MIFLPSIGAHQLIGAVCEIGGLRENCAALFYATSKLWFVSTIGGPLVLRCPIVDGAAVLGVMDSRRRRWIGGEKRTFSRSVQFRMECLLNY